MKKRLGDRKDGTLIRDIDPMHFICPLLYPNRCDNEAFFSECIDLTNVAKYLENKNKENKDGYDYNLFQVVVAIVLKTLTLRPKMNRFIANKNMYMRNEISASFVVKKEFDDNGAEALAFIHSKDTYTIDDVHRDILKQVKSYRGNDEEVKDSSSDSMEIVTKLPRFISKTFVSMMCWCDKRGLVPQSLIATDPYYSSVVLSNLGSIGLQAGYHHLTNWGTNSLFVAIGKRKERAFKNEKGNTIMKDSVDIGMTLDERLADGYYYSKTLRLIKYLFAHPEELDEPFNKKVEF